LQLLLQEGKSRISMIALLRKILTFPKKGGDTVVVEGLTVEVLDHGNFDRIIVSRD
jgi:hypothetical protein